MEDNNLQPTEVVDDTQKYLDVIAEMQRNSVPKDVVDKLREENARLLNAYANGHVDTGSAEPPKHDINELRKRFLEKDMNNLEYAQTTLDLRQASIEAGLGDPFLPIGQKIAPTAEDVQKANQVAAVLQECIDYADGDSAIFTNELQRRTIDVMPTRRR